MTTENKELDRQNTDASGGKQTQANDPKRDSWPVGVQFIFAVLVLLVVSVLLIGLPILSASIVSNETAGIALTDVVIPMFAVLIALTSMLVTGTFVFMSFRIDRGTRLEARREAAKAAKKEAKKQAEKQAEKTARHFLRSIESKFFKEVAELKKSVMDKAMKAKSKINGSVDGIAEHAKGAEAQIVEHTSQAETEITQQAKEYREGLSKVADTARESIEATAKEISQKLAEFDEFKAITDQLMNSPKLEKRVEELLLTKVNSSLFIEWLERNVETFAKMDRNDVRDLIRALKAATPPRKLRWSKDD